jgi:hypothetical protein
MLRNRILEHDYNVVARLWSLTLVMENERPYLGSHVVIRVTGSGVSRQALATGNSVLRHEEAFRVCLTSS